MVFAIIFHVASKFYGILAYFNDKEDVVTLFLKSDLWFWGACVMGSFILIGFVWLMHFTGTINSCLLSISHSTLYVGENYRIDESKVKEEQNSKDGSD